MSSSRNTRPRPAKPILPRYIRQDYSMPMLIHLKSPVPFRTLTSSIAKSHAVILAVYRYDKNAPDTSVWAVYALTETLPVRISGVWLSEYDSFAGTLKAIEGLFSVIESALCPRWPAYSPTAGSHPSLGYPAYMSIQYVHNVASAGLSLELTSYEPISPDTPLTPTPVPLPETSSLPAASAQRHASVMDLFARPYRVQHRPRRDGGRRAGEGTASGGRFTRSSGVTRDCCGEFGALRLAGDCEDDDAARGGDPLLAWAGCARRDTRCRLPAVFAIPDCERLLRRRNVVGGIGREPAGNRADGFPAVALYRRRLRQGRVGNPQVQLAGGSLGLERSRLLSGRRGSTEQVGAEPDCHWHCRHNRARRPGHHHPHCRLGGWIADSTLGNRQPQAPNLRLGLVSAVADEGGRGSHRSAA